VQTRRWALLIAVTTALGCWTAPASHSNTPTVEPRATRSRVSTNDHACAAQLDATTRAFARTIDSGAVAERRNETGLNAISFVTADGTVLYDAGVSDRPTFGFDGHPVRTDDTWLEWPSSHPELGEIDRSWQMNGREAWLSSNPAMKPAAVSADDAAAFAQAYAPILERCLRTEVAPQERRFELTATVRSIVPAGPGVHDPRVVLLDPAAQFVVTIRGSSVDPPGAFVDLYIDHRIAIADPAASFGAPLMAIVGKAWTFELRAVFQDGRTTWTLEGITPP